MAITGNILPLKQFGLSIFWVRVMLTNKLKMGTQLLCLALETVLVQVRRTSQLVFNMLSSLPSEKLSVLQ